MLFYLQWNDDNTYLKSVRKDTRLGGWIAKWTKDPLKRLLLPKLAADDVKWLWADADRHISVIEGLGLSDND